MKLVNAANGWTNERIEAERAECDRRGEIPRIPAQWSRPEHGIMWHHAVMNLPQMAVSFCDAFAGTFSATTWDGQLPLVHCYSFQKSESDEGVKLTPTCNLTKRVIFTLTNKDFADVIKKIETAIGGKLDEPAVVHKVRLVAPDKHHVCITFRIPHAVAFNSMGPDCKRAKIQDV